MVKTMEWQGQSLLLLDQTKLPAEIVTIICEDYRRVGEAINAWKYVERLLLAQPQLLP